MHESMKRLLMAAGTDKKSKIARDLNVGPSTVTNWTKRGVSKEGALAAAELYKTDANFLLTGVTPDRSKTDNLDCTESTIPSLYPDGDSFKVVPMDKMRRVPVLNYVEAGEFCEYFDDAIADMFEIIIGDYPPHVHWVIIEGLSMTPDFNPGDLILVDPDTQPSPGDYVVAKKAGENAVTFKKWRPRGFDDEGVEYCELVPLNPDFPIIDSRHTPFTVCGVAVEHKKKLK